jgi:hypothetical protein
MSQEISEENIPNLEILYKYLDDYMDIDHLLNSGETENLDINSLKLEKEVKYKVYQEELKNLKKTYPDFMKKKGRESAYKIHKLMSDGKIGHLIKDDLVESIIQMDIGYEPQINSVNNWGRECWDHLAIKFNENPDIFKNKINMHVKLSEKLKILIDQDIELKTILQERDPLNPVFY